MTDITAHLEPESVVLRHLRQPDLIKILEQNYESDPLSEGLLLRKSEGRTIDFEITLPTGGEKRIVKGKILRSGYIPHTSAFQRYGQQYQYSQMAVFKPARWRTTDCGSGWQDPIWSCRANRSLRRLTRRAF